ncbi:unnamed protein product [Linum tenue]|uniref:DUF4283 domain-containing protein n=1 Tax=Linum tenue TaxID=586396 RepID=A0AAV0GVI3_9ROSI|nr:unnamed protein product [Linum tenue]
MRQDGLDEGFVGEEDPLCPTIYFTAAEERTYCRKFRSALVVKALGRSVSYTAISLRLNTIWAKAGGIQVTSMKNNYFLVRFTSGLDYDRAITNGPWMIGQNYLSVHMWDRDFDLYNHEISSTLVWARLLDIPIQYFHEDAVMRIGCRIGKPVRIDEATRTAARSDYARVCVQVDLTKPLLSKFSIKGKRYFIQYEGLEKICLKCGTYTERGACYCSQTQVPMEAENVEPEPNSPPSQHENIYGEWMIAKRKPRPAKKEGGSTSNRGGSPVEEAHQRGGGSRFAVLDEEPDVNMVPPEVVNENNAPSKTKQQRIQSRNKHAKVHEQEKSGPDGSVPTSDVGDPNPTPTQAEGNGNKSCLAKPIQTDHEMQDTLVRREDVVLEEQPMQGGGESTETQDRSPPNTGRKGRPPDTGSGSNSTSSGPPEVTMKTRASGKQVGGSDPPNA